MSYRTLFALSLLLVLPLSSAQAQWGTLTGTFLFDGDVPSPSPIVVTKDQAVCGKHDLMVETMTVNPENKGISGIVVHVYVARGKKAPKVHESYAATEESKVRLDNFNCRYEPHVVTLRTTQTLVVGNRDSIGHNTKIDAVKNIPINPIIPANEEIEQQFPKEERMPVKVSCSIHPWMNAILVVKESPYMAVTDENGKFTIKNLPAGEWQFQVWQEASGYVDKVKIGGKATEWKRGRVKYTIKPGDNDMGEVLVPASTFN